MSETTTKQLKKFRLISDNHDEYRTYPSARAALNEALISACGVPTKLYRVLNDGAEVLLFDSEKTKIRDVRALLEKAEKGDVP